MLSGWAGGIAGVAVSDWASQYEGAIDMLRGFLTAFFGCTPLEKAEQYRASSPTTHAENIQAPAISGTNWWLSSCKWWKLEQI